MHSYPKYLNSGTKAQTSVHSMLDPLVIMKLFQTKNLWPMLLNFKLNRQLADAQQIVCDALNNNFYITELSAAQNIAIWAHSDDQGNFTELLQLCYEDKPSLKTWLAKWNNCTSDTIQKDILQIHAR